MRNKAEKIGRPSFSKLSEFRKELQEKKNLIFNSESQFMNSTFSEKLSEFIIFFYSEELLSYIYLFILLNLKLNAD